MGSGKGVNTVVTSMGNEEAGFGDSQIDILARVGTEVNSGEEGEVGDARDARDVEMGKGTITVIKSVRVESMREPDVRT